MRSDTADTHLSLPVTVLLLVATRQCCFSAPLECIHRRVTHLTLLCSMSRHSFPCHSVTAPNSDDCFLLQHSGWTLQEENVSQ